jgi:hypothetical protein
VTENGVTLTLRALHDAESDLVRDFSRAAERHATDHEFFHGATDMARWSREHVRKLAMTGKLWELELSEEPATTEGPLSALREKTAQMLGRRPEPALLLLNDLRDLHLAATDISLRWEMLAQTAQALRDDELLALASSCHPETLRQMRWSDTLIKQLSPQALTAL